MPANAPVVPTERDALVAYLVQQQDAFRTTTFGLTDEQASRAAVASSTLSLGGLLKHVTHCQQGWLDIAVAAPGRPAPVDQEQAAAAYADEFAFAATDSLADALAAYDAVCAAVLDAVRTLDLEEDVPVPDAPWFPRDVPAWNRRWVWFHLVEELARHAGHADLVREAVDGATMYELMAGYEGWPETPWLKPWRPAETVEV